MSGLTTLSKRIAALGIAGLAVAGTVAPALAQTYVVPERSYVQSWDRPFHGGYVSPQDGYAYGGYAYGGQVAPQWNSGMTGTECWTDEGYGRRTSCDAR